MPEAARAAGAAAQLLSGQEAILQRRHRGAEQQSQSHHEKSVRLSDLSSRRALPVSRTWQASRAETRPQILLKKRQDYAAISMPFEPMQAGGVFDGLRGLAAKPPAASWFFRGRSSRRASATSRAWSTARATRSVCIHPTEAAADDHECLQDPIRLAPIDAPGGARARASVVSVQPRPVARSPGDLDAERIELLALEVDVHRRRDHHALEYLDALVLDQLLHHIGQGD